MSDNTPERSWNYLHSTMFLLIRSFINIKELIVCSFTFHNVSINSQIGRSGLEHNQPFTFHNVSINSSFDFFLCTKPALFTFHNVSINSETVSESDTEQRNLHSTMFLLIHVSSYSFGCCSYIYIPQCFY